MRVEGVQRGGWKAVGTSRTQEVADASPAGSGTAQRMKSLTELAVRGLTEMYDPATSQFPQTMRGMPSSQGPTLGSEGESLRYTAMVALGLSTLTEAEQKTVLAGSTAAELAHTVASRATGAHDPGAVALAAWAAAEVAGEYAHHLFDRLDSLVQRNTPIPTVVCAWVLTAAVAGGRLADTEDLAKRVAVHLKGAQGLAGIFPHAVPAGSQRPFRAHVGCFADQVYPIQALTRFSVAHGDESALAVANVCAQRICDLQGVDGQWWWHYDVRDGSVVEGYPVYSVHQHAMAPMTLLELMEAGGADHRRSVALGLQWLYTHPEVIDELIREPLGVVWRKVGRRELRKASRLAAALTTSARPGLRLPGINRVWPPGRIDYECRPYELGWLLYAWGSSRGKQDVGRRGASGYPR